MKGYVQVYTGNGKGKTTAALGLTLRACGAGLRVYFGQFIKSGRVAEIKALADRFPDVTVEPYGRGLIARGRPGKEDTDSARQGMQRLRAAVRSGRYDVVVADEINVAVSLGLLPVEAVLRLIREKPRRVELVLTGRGAHRRVTERADLVTEMRNRKHYFSRGVVARPGIEK